MSIYQDSKADLTAALVTVMGAPNILVTDFDVLGAIPTTAAEATTSGKNTKVAIAARETSTTYAGTAKIFLDRLNLADLTKLSYYNKLGKPFAGSTAPNTSVYSLLTRLKNNLGAAFTTDDLVETFTTYNNTTGFVELVLTAKPGSPGWYGTTTIVMEPPEPLSNAFGSEYLTDL